MRKLYLCQDCEGDVDNRQYSYCPWCGEKLNWEKMAFYGDDK